MAISFRERVAVVLDEIVSDGGIRQIVQDVAIVIRNRELVKIKKKVSLEVGLQVDL